MTRSNDEKQNRIQRVAKSETRYCDLVQRNTPYYRFWLPVSFGKYKRLTLPEIILTDISYFCWLRDKLKGKLRWQADLIACRAAHILPLKQWRSRQFVFELDSSRRLLEVSLSKRHDSGDEDTTTWQSPHLDLKVFKMFRSPDRAAMKIERFMKRVYFGGAIVELTEPACAAFFDDQSHFEMACSEDHARLAAAIWRRTSRSSG